VSPKILVGYDGSDQARDALCLAEGLARVSKASLLLAYVERVGPYELPAPSVVDAIRERAETRLAVIAGEVRARGDEVETRPVLVGSPARGLHELAEHERPEFVVVGSSHRGRAGAVLLGTVGVRLLHGSSCPVAIAPRGLAARAPWSPRRIGVGYDSSPESRIALARARSIASDASTSLHILVAAEPLTRYIELYGQLDTSQVREQSEARLREALARVGGDVGADGEILDETAVTGLERAGAELDLLVVGSRGYGPVRRVLLGSVSAHLARTSACPLIVTPRAGGLEDDDPRPAAADAAAQR